MTLTALSPATWIYNNHIRYPIKNTILGTDNNPGFILVYNSPLYHFEAFSFDQIPASFLVFKSRRKRFASDGVYNGWVMLFWLTYVSTKVTQGESETRDWLDLGSFMGEILFSLNPHLYVVSPLVFSYCLQINFKNASCCKSSYHILTS